MKKIREYEIDGCIHTEDEILCKATLYNGGKISKRYENRPDLIAHIEKDFEENIVKPRYLQELKNGNLKYFKTDFVDSEPTDRNKKKLVDQSTEMLCLKEYCFDEIKTNTFFKIFTNHNKKLLGIIYDDDGIDSFKNEVKKIG